MKLHVTNRCLRCFRKSCRTLADKLSRDSRVFVSRVRATLQHDYCLTAVDDAFVALDMLVTLEAIFWLVESS